MFVFAPIGEMCTIRYDCMLFYYFFLFLKNIFHEFWSLSSSNGSKNIRVFVVQTYTSSGTIQPPCRLSLFAWQTCDTVAYPGRITPPWNIMHSVTYLDNERKSPNHTRCPREYISSIPAMCSFNWSYFLWWIHFQNLFHCWNVIWNALLGLLTVKLK